MNTVTEKIADFYTHQIQWIKAIIEKNIQSDTMNTTKTIIITIMKTLGKVDMKHTGEKLM